MRTGGARRKSIFSTHACRWHRSTLRYYYDPKTEMDAHMQRSAQEVERLRAQAGESPLRKRLREMGKLA